jgi:hypothetical protein
MTLPDLLVSPLLAGGIHVGLCAAVERGPSQGARSGSTGPAWVPPAYPSEAARCASTEDHQPPSPPPLCEQEGHLAAPYSSSLADGIP